MTLGALLNQVNYRVTIVFVGCPVCHAPRGVACQSKRGKVWSTDMHADRRSAARWARKRDPETWANLRKQALRPALPAWGLQ